MKILFFFILSFVVTFVNLYLMPPTVVWIVMLGCNIIICSSIWTKINLKNKQVFILFLFLFFCIIQGILLQLDIITILQPIFILLLYIIFYNFYLKYNNLENNLDKLFYGLLFILPFFAINITEWSSLRSGGIFINPNTTAYTALFVLPFLLLRPQKYFLRILSFLAVFLILGLTVSRGAVLAFALGLFSYYFIMKCKIKLSYTMLIAYTVLMFFVSLYIVDIVEYFLRQTLLDVTTSRLFETSYSGRDILKDYALKDFYASPIIGNGFGAGKYDLNGKILGAHNGYLDILVRVGLVGIILFISLISTLIYDISKLHNKRFKAVGFMCLIMWISLSTSGSIFLGINYFTFYILLLFACVFNLDKLNIKVSRKID